MKTALPEFADPQANPAQAPAQLVQDIVRELLEEAKPLQEERRAELRHPFFRPVQVIVEEGGGQRNYSCFSRDISFSGIGLLHNMPVRCGEAILTFPREAGGQFRVQATIRWCRPCGEGWYLSGAQFSARPPSE